MDLFASSVRLNEPQGLAFDQTGTTLYCANTYDNSIVKIDTSGTATTFVSGLNGPTGLAFDQSGTLYCANRFDNSIVKIDRSGTATTFVSSQLLNSPTGLAFDQSGTLYCANQYVGSIVKIDTSGTATTFVSGLNGPTGLAFDQTGTTLYCANQFGNSIVKIDTSGTATTFVSGLNGPNGLAFDKAGTTLYCANEFGNSIVKIDTSGTATTFVSSQLLNGPNGLAFDQAGTTLYCANRIGNSIVKIDTISNIIITYANINSPSGLAFDSSQYLYASSYSSNGIYKSTAVACFNHDTKILCLNSNFHEEYIPIQNLKKGDLVKSFKHGYRRIDMIGYNTLYNQADTIYKCMYRMVKDDENQLIEDLIITGGHSILVDELTKEQSEKQLKYGFSQTIDDKHLLHSHISDKFVKEQNNNLYTYYHFCLENDGDDDRRFGVWANGILVEITSKNLFLEYSYKTI